MQSTSFQRPTNKDTFRGLKVLVVDDSCDNRVLFSLILNKAGFLVECVGNGQEAVARAMVGNFDIVLMDINMPIMDGIEATRKIRSLGYQNPIIALTAESMIEERARTADAGCDAHLTKPINISEFMKTIADCVALTTPKPKS